MLPLICKSRRCSKGNLPPGEGAILAKVDIKNAYCIVLFHPDDRPLLGQKPDCGLCPLLWPRSTQITYSSLADVLEWRLTFEGIPFVLHYLDDFFKSHHSLKQKKVLDTGKNCLLCVSD